MALPDLRVRYDRPETLHEMLDWLVDSDPIELRDVAQNLLADVETLKAALAAAEARGRAGAIADLRDDEAHDAFAASRLGGWMASDLAAGRGPTGWNGRDVRGWYARYLEARTTPAEVSEPCADATRTRLTEDGQYRVTQAVPCVLSNGHPGRHRTPDGREWDWIGDGFDVAMTSGGALDRTLRTEPAEVGE